MIFGPGMFSGTFALFLAPGLHFPGAPWILAAVLLVVSIIIAGAVVPGADQQVRPPQLVEVDAAE